MQLFKRSDRYLRQVNGISLAVHQITVGHSELFDERTIATLYSYIYRMKPFVASPNS